MVDSNAASTARTDLVVGMVNKAFEWLMSFLSPECPCLYYGEGYHKYSDKSRLSKATSTHPGLYTKGIIETPDVHPNPASPAVDLGPPKRGELCGLSGCTHFSLNVSAIEFDVNPQGSFLSRREMRSVRVLRMG